MKKLILSMAFLCVMSCASAVSPSMFPTSGPVMRLVERVVKRHDAYVFADNSLTTEARLIYMTQSKSVMQLMGASMDGLPASELVAFLPPVLDRHDAYVQGDAELDSLARDTYLGSSSGLRTLLTDSVWSR
jgi:hypothetical protein